MYREFVGKLLLWVCAYIGHLLYDKMPVRVFFLPEGLVVFEFNHAIPQRFHIKAINGNHEIEEEPVYGLEAPRYPFKVQLMKDLPERMITHIKDIIGDKPVTPSLRLRWEMCTQIRDNDLELKVDLHSAMLTFCLLVEVAYHIIHPDNECTWKSFPTSQDKLTNVDIQIEVDSDPVVLIELIEPTIADVCTSRLVDLASGNGTSIFEGELPENFTGHDAILARLCYVAMDNWPQGPRWAIAHGGNDYVIYLVLPVLVGNTRRCILMPSGVLSIDDTKCLFPALLLYMTLSARLTLDGLLMALNIELPRGCSRVPFNDFAGKETADIVPQLGTFDPLALSTAQHVYLSTPLNPSRQICAVRLSLDRPDEISHGQPNGNSPSLMLQHYTSGYFNAVYRSGEVIVKTSLPGWNQYFEYEARVYQYLTQSGASKFIPTFYGYFAHRHTKYIMVSYEGPPLKDFPTS